MTDHHSELAIAYKAPNMIAANMVKGLLENNNIPTIIRSLQMLMYDDLALMHNEIWGEILVPHDHLDQAKYLINQYLKLLEPEQNTP